MVTGRWLRWISAERLRPSQVAVLTAALKMPITIRNFGCGSLCLCIITVIAARLTGVKKPTPAIHSGPITTLINNRGYQAEQSLRAETDNFSIVMSCY